MKVPLTREALPIHHALPKEALIQILPGETARIFGFNSSILSGKFLSMGILPGASIRLIRKLPLSGSYYVQVENSFFALRKQEAAAIIVQK